MKKIFIYYSLSGNGDTIAEYLKGKNIDIRKVITKKPLPNNTILRILTGGFLAGINHKDPLMDFNSDISNYDKIIIGSPIWNDHLSCPINSVLSQIDLHNKDITFMLYSGSGKAPKTISRINEKYKNAQIIVLKEPKKDKALMKQKLNNI